MLDEFDKHQEDEEILKEIKESKKDKSFSAIISKRILNKFELDEIME